MGEDLISDWSLTLTTGDGQSLIWHSRKKGLGRREHPARRVTLNGPAMCYFESLTHDLVPVRTEIDYIRPSSSDCSEVNTIAILIACAAGSLGHGLPTRSNVDYLPPPRHSHLHLIVEQMLASSEPTGEQPPAPTWRFGQCR
jgi:hypothetical protein